MDSQTYRLVSKYPCQNVLCLSTAAGSQELWLHSLSEMTQIFLWRTTLWHQSPEASCWTVVAGDVAGGVGAIARYMFVFAKYQLPAACTSQR